jgi:rod shape determining protein RodA
MWRRFDWLAFLVTVLLLVTGGLMIYSSYERSMPTANDLVWENAVVRQAAFAGIGLVLYVALTVLDYDLWLRLYRWVYASILALLGATQILGYTRFGAQSWFQFERFDVQSSELCKVLMILVLAQVLGRSQRKLESPLPFFQALGLMLPPVVLIYLQPDFGTAVIVVATCAGIIYLSGVRWRHMLLVMILLAAAAPLIWFSLEDYMRGRVLSFILPGADSSGDSYNINQALISIGSGGWWGRGLFQGTQTQLYFLRVRHTDFIFSVLAEELGFVGATTLVILFGLLITCLVRTALRARDPGGRLIAGGVATMIMVQALINMGMNANLLPVTGLPLPLVSYGGSSLVTTLLALGLAQSVAVRRPQPDSRLPHATITGRMP